MNIPISTAKRIREDLRATAVVILAVDETGQCVATHGESAENANAAAAMGNLLKTALDWPAELCQEKPLPRICKNCKHWGKETECEDYRTCFAEKVGSVSGNDSIVSGEHIFSASGSILTGPDFGCIHFDPK